MPTSQSPNSSPISARCRLTAAKFQTRAGSTRTSSITQLVAGYSFTPRFALQVNVPLISHSFERPEGFTIDRGTECCLGDISLLGKFVVFHKEAGGSRKVKFDDPKNPRSIRRLIGTPITATSATLTLTTDRVARFLEEKRNKRERGHAIEPPPPQ